PRRRARVDRRAGGRRRVATAAGAARSQAARGRGRGLRALGRPRLIQLPPQLRILVATEPVDFRKGIDGLAAVVKGLLEDDPFSGAVFVFRNRRATAIKVLVYDGQGFWLCLKRLSSGRFR